MRMWNPRAGLALVAAVALSACGGSSNDPSTTPTTYTVTFDANGGSAVAPITGVAAGATVTLPAAPTRGGYTFAGWFTDNTTFANAFTVATAVNSNLTVYAKWDAVPAYTVTFNANGGSAVAPITGVAPGATVTLPASPTRAGYNFEGWFTDNGAFTHSFTGATAVNADVTVHAWWVATSYAYGYVSDFEPTTAQTVAIGSDVKFSDNGALAGMTHTAGTSGITFTEAGVYQVTLAVNASGNNPESWGLAVNGTVAAYFTCSGQTMILESALLSLNAGDVLTLRNVGTGFPPNGATFRVGVVSVWMQIEKTAASAYGYAYDQRTGTAQAVAVGSNALFNTSGPLANMVHPDGASSITVSMPGNYNVTWVFNSNANNPQDWGVAVNGAVVQRFQSSGQNGAAMVDLALNAGDVVSLRNVGTYPDPANTRLDVRTTSLVLNGFDRPLTGVSANGYAYQVGTESIAIDSDLTFSNNGVLQEVTHTAGTAQLTASHGGLYFITFGINTQGNNPELWGVTQNGDVVRTFGASGQSIIGGAQLLLSAGDAIGLRNLGTGSAPNGAILRTCTDCASAWIEMHQVDW